MYYCVVFMLLILVVSHNILNIKFHWWFYRKRNSVKTVGTCPYNMLRNMLRNG